MTNHDDDNKMSESDLLDIVELLEQAFKSSNIEASTCLVVPVKTRDGSIREVAMVPSSSRVANAQSITAGLGVFMSGTIH